MITSTRACMIVLSLALSGSLPVSAQTGGLFNPGDRDSIAKFRPSMEAVTRCNQASKALANAAKKDARLRAEIAAEDADTDSEASIEQTVKQIEKRAPVASAMLTQNGCPLRDYFLIATQSMIVKMVGVPEVAKDVNFLPPETVAFWQKNGVAADRLLEEAGKVLEFEKR
jgi:hypothetical protein